MNLDEQEIFDLYFCCVTQGVIASNPDISPKTLIATAMEITVEALRARAVAIQNRTLPPPP